MERPDPELWRETMQAQAAGDRERVVRASFDLNLSAAWTARYDSYAPFRELVLALPVAPVVIGRQLQAILGFDVSGRLGELEASTLVLHGSEDRVVPPANGERLAREIPGARFEWLDGAGHMFFCEQPEHSAELVRSRVLAAA